MYVNSIIFSPNFFNSLKLVYIFLRLVTSCVFSDTLLVESVKKALFANKQELFLFSHHFTSAFYELTVCGFFWQKAAHKMLVNSTGGISYSVELGVQLFASVKICFV